jgi:hypothetical protein
MRQICGDCGSGNLRDDFDKRGKRTGRYCFMCGSKNIKEVEKEEGMSEKKKCSVEGCEKVAVVEGICWRHYHEKHGHTYKPGKHYKKAEEKPKKEKTKARRHTGSTSSPFTSRGVFQQEPDGTTAGQPYFGPPRPLFGPEQLPVADNAVAHAAALASAIVPAEWPRPNSVQIDFTGHDELFQLICEEAKKEFRPIEFQILYLLDAFREVKNGSIPDPAEG